MVDIAIVLFGTEMDHWTTVFNVTVKDLSFVIKL